MGGVQGGRVHPLEREEDAGLQGRRPGWGRAGSSFKLTMAQLHEYLHGAGLAGGVWGDGVGSAGGSVHGEGDDEATEPSELGHGPRGPGSRADSPGPGRTGSLDGGWAGSRRDDSDDLDSEEGEAEAEAGWDGECEGGCSMDGAGDGGDMAGVFLEASFPCYDTPAPCSVLLYCVCVR